MYSKFVAGVVLYGLVVLYTHAIPFLQQRQLSSSTVKERTDIRGIQQKIQNDDDRIEGRSFFRGNPIRPRDDSSDSTI
jgi:hypothetical protein